MKHRFPLTLVLFFLVQSFALLTACNNTDSAPGPGGNTGSSATTVLNLTPDFIALSGIEQGGDYEPGSTLTLTLTPGEILSSGFESYHMEHIHIHVNDAVCMPEFTASEGESLTTLSVDITVPDSDFEVVACYSVQQQLTDGGHTMLLEENPSVRLYGVSPEKGYRYFDCYLLTADAYTITDVEFSIGGGEWRSLAETTGCSFTRSALVDNAYQVTVRPDYEDVTGDVTLRVVGEQHARHSITWEHAEDTYLDLEQSTLPTESIDGEQVTAELRVKPDYYLASADISAQGVEPELIERIYVRFEMPAEDVTVTLNFMEKIAVSCTASDHVSEATFYDADDIYYGVPTDKGIPGETVYLFATADEGYKPMQARISSGETFAFEHYAYAMYRAAVRIPDTATELKATVEVAEAYTVSGNENITFNGGTLYAEGETVSMSIYVPEGQRIASVKATDAEGGEVAVTLDLPYAGFVMPASDVTVEVTYEDIDAGSTVSVIAYYNADTFDVYSTTNYDWDFAEGFTMNRGATFYLTVYNYEGTEFYVGVKVGETVTIYPADFDDMMGEYSFGKALVADDDVVIKVGASEAEVAF